MCQFCLSCAHLNSKLHQRCDKPTSHGFMPRSVVRELNFKRPAFCLSLVQVLECSGATVMPCKGFGRVVVDLETVLRPPFGNKVFLSVSLRETLETSCADSPILANALTVGSLRLIGGRLRLARSIQNMRQCAKRRPGYVKLNSEASARALAGACRNRAHGQLCCSCVNVPVTSYLGVILPSRLSYGQRV